MKNRRKFDNDVDNPFRICEQLHYHCENDSRYISVLNVALKEYGITDADDEQKISAFFMDSTDSGFCRNLLPQTRGGMD